MSGTHEPLSQDLPPDLTPRNGVPPAPEVKKLGRTWGSVTSWARGGVHDMALPEEDEPEGALDSFVVSTPPWLISLVIHIGIVMGLGLIVLEARPRSEPGIEVDLGGQTVENGDDLPVGEQLTDPTQTVSTQGPDDVSESSPGRGVGRGKRPGLDG